MILITEEKIKIGKNLINFVVSKLKDVKVERTLFLIPGGLESAQSAFQPQIENLPKLLPNFQVISYDPPGIGKSRPPNRREFKVDGKFVTNRQESDAKIIAKGLRQLNVDKFSLLGWSYGGIVASHLATKFPERVEKLVLLSTFAYIDKHLVERLEMSRDVSLWPETMRKNVVEVYGFEEFKKIWSELVDNHIEIFKTKSIMKQTEIFRKIERPTLIFHGVKDFYIDDTAAKFLNDNIKNSRLIVLDGGHNLHQKNYQKFNQQLAEFLKETPKL